MHKAVILARGLGTRMRAGDAQVRLDPNQVKVADSGVKALIPVGRPFLDYVLSALADAGYRQICLVVAPDHAAIRSYYEDQICPERVQVQFAVQEEPKGTADAVAAAEEFAGMDSFLVLNSDNYYPVAALRALSLLEGCGTALFARSSLVAEGIVSAKRISAFAIGRIDAQGFLERIVEKPDLITMKDAGEELWVSMNCWRFRATVFEACRKIQPSVRGELEIPDAVDYARRELGERFQVVRIREPVLDLTSRRDIAAVATELKDVEVRL